MDLGSITDTYKVLFQASVDIRICDLVIEVWEQELKGTGESGETFSMFEEAFLKCSGAMGKRGGTYTTETNSTKCIPALGKMVGSEVLESLSQKQNTSADPICHCSYLSGHRDVSVPE